ncbi:MAG: hypothetical protein IT578_09955 [Verrucomicrobiae bacterium]|nr:hypothetical protein [Verrucomicrobiae bacterium]
MESFHAFGWTHLAALGVIATLGVATVRVGRRLGDTGRVWMARGFAAALAAYAIVAYTRRFTSPDLR